MSSKKETAQKSENIYFDIVKTGKQGRPKLILNEKGKQLIFALSKIMCTDEEIAACLDSNTDTLLNTNNRGVFTEIKLKGKEQGKMSLRRTQFRLAEKSASMAIFLGKNYLGQTDGNEMRELKIASNEQNQLVLALRDVAKNMGESDEDVPEGILVERDDA